MSKDWVKGAVKHPGALRKATHTPSGKNIPKSVLNKDAAKKGKLGREARLAKTLEGMRRK